MKRLSIIVPVYQVEKYIRACVESIFRQGLEEELFDVILVNDGTRDESFERIADIIQQHKNISVIEQENQGLSAARNTGLEKATGDYVLFLDSDDVLVDNTLKPMLQDLEQHKPDLLVAGFIKLENLEQYTHLPIPKADYRSYKLTSSDLFINNLNPRECYVWRTLYRREFLNENDLRFISGIYFEDVPFTTECYLKAQNCLRTNHIFYIYRQRPDSIVSAINKRKVMDFHQGIAHLWKIRKTMTLSRNEQRKLMDIIFATFSVETWYITHSPELLAERKDFVKDLKEQVPDLCFTNGMKQRFISLMFKLMPSLYLKIKSL